MLGLYFMDSNFSVVPNVGLLQRQSPGIDSASLCSLEGRYDNPIFTRFLAPIDCSKMPALLSVSVNIIEY